jgi:hypothetical protein
MPIEPLKSITKHYTEQAFRTLSGLDPRVKPEDSKQCLYTKILDRLVSLEEVGSRSEG